MRFVWNEFKMLIYLLNNFFQQKELSKTDSFAHEPSTSKTDYIDNKIQDQHTPTKSTHFDADLKIIHLENEKKKTSVKVQYLL